MTSELAPPPSPPGPPDEPEASRARFPVVGIGASAGGLEAVTDLVKAITLDHIALVVVQHLSPTHASMLPELLARVTQMTVLAITDGVRIERNHIYVTPPNAQVRFVDGALHLGPPAGRHSIDVFLRTLADGCGPDAIGVVLSGMGSDGSLGLKAIKEHGGITFVQSPGTAKFEAMPQSAIDSDVADRVLTAHGIGAELMEISHHPYLARATPPQPHTNGYGKVFGLVRTAFGNDLTLYKQTTIQRRLERRMALRHVEDLDEYVAILRAEPPELAALYQDVLINVTSFFRDRAPFDMLRSEIFPQLAARKEPGDTIRVWVPACATGEEAYSVGICLLEALDGRAGELRIQIFATDVDAEAIEQARRAIYKSNIELDVTAERLGRFFTKVDSHYQVHRRLRDLIVFSTQNVTTDAPFSKLDFICCRNLLIYMQPVLQKRVLQIFHYALRPDALLLLGTSETVGDSADLFTLLDRKDKLYAKKNLRAGIPLDLGRSTTLEGPHPSRADRRVATTVQHLADRRILDRYAPPSALLDESFDVVHFRGDTGPYLGPSSGMASLNILRLVRPELAVDLGRALDDVRRTSRPVRLAPVRVGPRQPGTPARQVSLELHPIEDPETRSRCILVIFHEVADAPFGPLEPIAPAEPPVTPASADSRERVLEEQLIATKEYLQTAIEELQSANEELKSTNEELQSSNEELQSTNEELETSKEELRATNEELSTVNGEMHHKLADLSDGTNDLNNLLRTLREPTLFISDDGRVRRCSQSAADHLGLEATDAGRSVEFLRGILPDADLGHLVARASSRVSAVTAETRSADGHWYELTVTPYTTPDATLSGALVALENVDGRHSAVELAIDVQEYAGKLLSAIPHPLAVVDKHLRVVWVNVAFLDFFRVTPKETMDNLLTNLGNGQWAHPKLREAIQSALDDGASFAKIQVEHEFESVGRHTMLVSGSRILGVGLSEVVLLSIEEIGPARGQA